MNKQQNWLCFGASDIPKIQAQGEPLEVFAKINNMSRKEMKAYKIEPGLGCLVLVKKTGKPHEMKYYTLYKITSLDSIAEPIAGDLEKKAG